MSSGLCKTSSVSQYNAERSLHLGGIQSGSDKEAKHMLPKNRQCILLAVGRRACVREGVQYRVLAKVVQTPLRNVV